MNGCVVMDRLDFLLQAADEPKKDSRGFNLSEDVLSVIDTFKPGKRSQIVDLILRDAFEKKGLLSSEEA